MSFLMGLLPGHDLLAQADSGHQVLLVPDSGRNWYREHGYRINQAYVVSYFQDFPKVALSPLKFTAKNWRNVGLVTAGAGAFFLADKFIYKTMRSNQSQFITEVAGVVEPFGNRYPPLIVGALYLTGLATGNRKIEHASLFTAKSLVFSTLFYVTTKQVVRRRRPQFTDNPYHFNAPFEGGREYTSFPSGHTNTIFTVATALALEFRDTKWVPPLAYTIATLTAVSRLYENRHWSSDVWMGAALGHFITRALYKVEQMKRQPVTKKLEF